jgi:fatty acid desaturase
LLSVGVCSLRRLAAGLKAEKKERHMLWTIALVLLILWALGLVSGATIGGFIHVLLVIAIVVVLIRIIQGRNVV